MRTPSNGEPDGQRRRAGAVFALFAAATAGCHLWPRDVAGTYVGRAEGTITPDDGASREPVTDREAASVTFRREADSLVMRTVQNGREIPCSFVLRGGPVDWTFSPGQTCLQGRPDDGTIVTITGGTARFTVGRVQLEWSSTVTFTGPEAPMRSGRHRAAFSGRRQ